MLDDHAGAKLFGARFKLSNGCACLLNIEVEGWHALSLAAFFAVIEVASQQDRAGFRQVHQK